MVALTQTAPTPLPVDAAARLAAQDDEDFRAIVDADARGDVAEPWRSALRDERVSRRWKQALVLAKQEIEASFTVRGAELEALKIECLAEGAAGYRRYALAKNEHDRWRGRALWAKKALEARLREASELVRAQNTERAKRDTAHRMQLYRTALRRIAQADDVSPEDLIDIAVEALERGGDGWEDPRDLAS